MTNEVRELVIVAMLLLTALGLHALGNVEGASMCIGAACALVVPRAGTVTRVAVALLAGGIIATSAAGCGTVGKPEVREAVRLGCQVADWALSGDCAESEGE